MSGARSVATVALPVVALGLAAAFHLFDVSAEHMAMSAAVLFSLFCIGLVIATVLIVIEHAEAVAARVGEPFGTLILTFAVTAIEASIIVSTMLHGSNNPTLARESVFSTVMIVTTGILGLCLTVGGLKHGHQDIKKQGTTAFLSVLIALAVLSLILPNHTVSSDSGTFSPMQLAFVSVLSVLLYGSFLFAQMISHRDDFVEEAASIHADHHHATGNVGVHAALLVVGLLGIVLLTEQVAVALEGGLDAMHVPQPDAVMGAFIATLVLMPEAGTALRAAGNDELQRSLNVALGSACATIGLTIPVVAAASLLNGHPLTLGLGRGDTVLLLLALLISIISFGTGRTTVLTGLVHLVVFVAYLLLILVP